MVKKSLLIVACLLSVVLFALTVANSSASGLMTDTASWARIVNDDVYLYLNAELTMPLFVLAKSYYVEILDEVDYALQVEVKVSGNDFVSVVGYVKSSEVSLCQAPPIAPYYPAVKVKVTADSADMMLEASSASTTVCAVLNSQEVCYYGVKVSAGVTWYYVRYAKKFGYVAASQVAAPQIPLHPTPLPQKPASTTPSTPNEPTDTKPQSKPTWEILLSVFVVVLAVGLMLALFLPGNLKKKNSVFEEDI